MGSAERQCFACPEESSKDITEILYLKGFVDPRYLDGDIRMGCFDLFHKWFCVHEGGNRREKVVLMVGYDHLRGEGHDISVTNSGDMGVPLHGYQEDVNRFLSEFFQFTCRGTAAAKVVNDFSLEADAPAEHLTFRKIA